MIKAVAILFIGFLSFFSPKAHSELNLKVKIHQIIGTKTIEMIKTVSTNYGQDIVIMPEGGVTNKIVLSLRKFKNIMVNGNKINPVQIDMKIFNEMKKLIGKPQTITSFYNKSAQFNSVNTNVSLNFEEI
jgi:flagellar biosynthesis GTPase FlhF